MKHIPLVLLGVLISALALSVARADTSAQEIRRSSFVFDVLDQDNDSLLTFAEFFSVTGNDWSRDQWADSGRRFAVMDENSDGIITAEEFAAGWGSPYLKDELLRVSEGMSTE